ncbi:MAG: hypothetical protein ACN6P0_14945 [Pseudomonas capeferrum]|uniref:hypothetical protein n=1 Tax=Pseudomonas capeferrum TaxID=1495066 RepID=UPI003D0ECA1D
MLSRMIREHRKKSDVFFLLIACASGIAVGSVLVHKISWSVGVPFAVVASLFLYYTWRNPEK